MGMMNKYGIVETYLDPKCNYLVANFFIWLKSTVGLIFIFVHISYKVIFLNNIYYNFLTGIVIQTYPFQKLCFTARKLIYIIIFNYSFTV